MCQAIREMWQDGVNEGITQGISLGRREGVTLSAAIFHAIRSGIGDNEEIAGICETTIDEVINVRKIFEI